MRSSTPVAFFSSLLIHGTAIGTLALLTYYATLQESAPPVIFELVAGPPTSPGELAAPALGNTPNPVKLDVPKVDLPPEPAPAIEKPSRQEAAPDPTPPVAPAKPKPANSIAKELRRSERMSYKDYLKKHPIPKPTQQVASTRGGAVPRIDQQGIVNGVRGGSTANTRGGEGGRALTREEQDEMNTYFSYLLNQLHAAHEPPPGVSDQLMAVISFDLSADGVISNPRVAQSSGNRAFDESALAAFRSVNPGPPPNHKSDSYKVNFRMKEAEG